MPSRSHLELKARLVLGVGLLGIVVVLLLRLLLPVLAFGGLVIGGYYLWQQWSRQQQQRQRQQNRVNAQFYQLLQQQQGRISVLDFAMRTQLTGEAAQDYLNTQAQAFSAFFETTLQGDIIYVFNLAAVRHPSAQAEAAWAYAEQVRAERAHAEKAQAAWTNAKQIRTLHQLSQKNMQEGSKRDRPLIDYQQPAQQQPAQQPQKRVIDLLSLEGSAQRDSVQENHTEGGVITIDVKAVGG